MKLKGKIAIVTGGAGGVGRAIAERYAKEGARVCVADVNVSGAKTVAAEIGGGAFAVDFDSSKQESIDRMVTRVVSEAGGVDILVNNAGVFVLDNVENVTREDWARVSSINTEGVLFTMQAVARQMIKQGRGGKVVNLSSQAGRRGEALVLTYCASKAAVISITQSAALQLIKHGINVNAIAPGVVDTPMWDQVDREFAKALNKEVGQVKLEVGEAVPCGRMGKPSDYEGVAVFLASADSDYVVAQTFGVDGGNWMA